MANGDANDNLDLALTQATNPLDRELNLDAVQKLCQLILLSRDAPQEVLRIIAHKVQSPQEREALRALEVLEECVSRCGGKLNNEVGKFRFLNELIRVVSPKYLGQRAPESVKRRVVEILYKWSVLLAHETKIVDAYAMLKRQGVVEEDPVHVLPREDDPAEQIEALPPREDEIFTDKQKELELKRLLGSKNPEDLQAANRLIKTMVKEADRKMDLKGRKLLDLEEAASNCAVFSSLLKNFEVDMRSDELELLQQMFENCDKLRPKLFTLASEFSLIEDFGSVQEVLQRNDELTTIISEYKERVAPIIVKRQTLNNSAPAPLPPRSEAITVTGASSKSSGTATCVTTTSDRRQAPTLAVTPTATSTAKRSTAATSAVADDEAAATATASSVASCDEQLNFDPLTSKCVNQPANQNDDVSLLDSQMSSLTVSPTTDMLISIDGSAAMKHTDLLSLIDLNLTAEASTPPPPLPSQTPPASAGPVVAGLSAAATISGQSATVEPLHPTQVPCKGPSRTPPASGPSSNTSSSGGQSRTYAPFEGLDTMMSETILAKRSENPPAARTNLSTLDEISLADIVPSTQPPVVLSCRDDVTTILSVTENRPAEDVLVVLVTTTNRNSKAAVKRFSCSVTSQSGQSRALPASGDQLPMFNSFVPSTAITQIVLLEKLLPSGVNVLFTLSYELVSAGGSASTPVTISGEKQL